MAYEVFPLPEITYPLSIDSIGKCIALGDGVTVYCDPCNRYIEIDMLALARKVGPGHGVLAKDLKPHFYCAACRRAGKPDKNIGFLFSPNRLPYSSVRSASGHAASKA